MNAVQVQASLWAVGWLVVGSSVIVLARGLLRRHLWRRRDSQTHFRKWCWQVFAIGPRFTLLGAGIMWSHLWHLRSLTLPRMIMSAVFVLVLVAYCLAELLHTKVYRPGRPRFLTPEGVLGLWIPLFIGGLSNTTVLLATMLAYQQNGG